jgi:hypothetical protein
MECMCAHSGKHVLVERDASRRAVYTRFLAKLQSSVHEAASLHPKKASIIDIRIIASLIRVHLGACSRTRDTPSVLKYTILVR